MRRPYLYLIVFAILFALVVLWYRIRLQPSAVPPPPSPPTATPVPAAPPPTAPAPPVLDHFLCYLSPQGGTFPPDLAVDLWDQFDDADRDGRSDPGEFDRFQIHGSNRMLCNPVRKRRGDSTTEVVAPDHHLVGYPGSEDAAAYPGVYVTNQFTEGDTEPRLHQPTRTEWLLVPTHKLEPGPHEPPRGLDHFLCYAFEQPPPAVGARVDLRDELGAFDGINVQEPKYLCNPVVKRHARNEFEIQHPDRHLVCYAIEPNPRDVAVSIENQLEPEPVDLLTPLRSHVLCVPSLKEIPKPGPA